jgi:hypothetical protein
MSLTKVSYSMIAGSPVNVLDFGAVGDGVADDTLAIQAAINYVQSLKDRPTIVFPVGKYKITSTITITADCVSLFGLGMPSLARGDDSGFTTRGPTLRYYGTGTALQIGIAPGVNGNFIRETNIQNLRIEVDNNTARAMHVWQSSQGYFKNISIFGNKGLGNIGLHVQAGTTNIYEQIFVNGQGQTIGSGVADYLGSGMKLDLGYLNDLATTTVFRRCYITYCNHGVDMNYRYDFEDTVFESCDVGVASISYMTSNFQRCWWEANITLDIYFAGNSDGDTALINNSLINSYTRQIFFATGNGAQQITIDGCQIVTSNANPQLFGGGANIVATSPPGLLTLSNNRFSANTILGGIQNNDASSFPLVQNKDQKLVVYRFVQKAITLGFATDMDTEDAIAGKAFFMPRRGNVVGVNLWYSGSLGGGDFNISTKINGSGIADLSFPTVPAMTTEPQFRMCDPMKHQVAAGDALTFYLGTNGFSGGDFVAEVYVLHGSSGRP